MEKSNVLRGTKRREMWADDLNASVPEFEKSICQLGFVDFAADKKHGWIRGFSCSFWNTISLQFPLAATAATNERV